MKITGNLKEALTAIPITIIFIATIALVVNLVEDHRHSLERKEEQIYKDLINNCKANKKCWKLFKNCLLEEMPLYKCKDIAETILNK